MKSYGNLWPRIVSLENLTYSWQYFRRLHPGEPKVRYWGRNAEGRLRHLHTELASGAYRPNAYVTFRIFEPKPRTICRASIRDRIVHHALCQYAVPVIERRFIERTYSCRRCKGTHLALRDARRLAARGGYFLKLDIRHYFDTINLDLLEDIVLPLFREHEVRHLIRQIIGTRDGLEPYLPDPRVGLPLGNLTSQWFANLYLDALDHMIVEDLGFGRRYLRYMDDMLFFCDTKEQGHATHRAVADWLRVNRRLELKEQATVVAPVTEGIPFLGLRIWADRWRMQRRRFVRARKVAESRYAEFIAGRIDAQRLQKCNRSQDGAFRSMGFRGVLRHTGERTLARHGLAAADDGLPLVQGEAGGKEQPFSVSALGGSWKYSTNHCTAYRCENKPSNNNNENGFRLASARPEPVAVSAATWDTGGKDASVSTCSLGGSWKWSANHCTAYRCENTPSNINNENGFRLASARPGRHGPDTSETHRPWDNPVVPAPRTSGDEHARTVGGPVGGGAAQRPRRPFLSSHPSSSIPGEKRR